MLFYVLAMLGGVLIASQAPLNAKLAAAMPHAIWAAFISFAVGALTLLAFVVWRGAMPRAESVAAVPWWAWLGGVCGAFYVFAATTTIPRIGSLALTACTVLGMAVASLVLDGTGILGVTLRAPTPLRLVGIVCVALGALLISRG